MINDILNFFKIEFERLNVKKIQFNLSIMNRDVNKMLSFVAKKKHFAFENNIRLDNLKNLIVMNNFDRFKQIFINLLINNIKFIFVNFVTLTIAIQKKIDDIIEVVFIVENTGIKIEKKIHIRFFKSFNQANSNTTRRFGEIKLKLIICKNVIIIIIYDIEEKIRY